MTIYGYNVVMKRVGTAELKAKLSAYLRAVRRGDTVTVLDRNEPIARIVPYEAGPGLRIRRPADGGRARLAEIPLPPPLGLKTDVVSLLLEDRRTGR